MSDFYSRYGVTADQMKAQHESSHRHAVEAGARAQAQTQNLTEKLVEAQQVMLDAQNAADVREIKMLFWTRVAGIGALLALAVSIIAIVVTVAVSP